MRVCDECGGKHYAKGKCALHYKMPSQLNPKPIQRKPIGTVTDITEQWKAKNTKNYKPSEIVNKKLYIKATVPKRTSLPELLRLTELVFNRFIRERDKGANGFFKCACCGKQFPNEEMDAGHVFQKTYSALRFHEDNVFGQSQSCNRLEYGNIEEYKERVKEKIGEERWQELLKLKFTDHKWNREELLEIINKYKI